MLHFNALENPDDSDELLSMMRGLYNEDPAGSENAPSDEDFRKTVEFFIANPARGRIILLMESAQVQGYGILVPHWSNEFGGTILFIDELFVKPEARSRGIGRAFLDSLKETKPFDAVACALEVSEKNDRARRLYKAAGFRQRGHTMMARRF